MSVVAHFHDAHSAEACSSLLPMPEPKRPALNRARERHQGCNSVHPFGPL